MDVNVMDDLVLNLMALKCQVIEESSFNSHHVDCQRHINYMFLIVSVS